MKFKSVALVVNQAMRCEMSKEAMKYALSLKVKYFTTRNVLLAIAKKTFNDSGVCRAGYEGLMEEIGCSRRTLGRYICRLKELGLIETHRRRKEGVGSQKDDIEIVGFKDWLLKQDQTVPQVASSIGSNVVDHSANLATSIGPLATLSSIDTKTSTSRDKSKRQGIYHDRYRAEGADTTQELPPQLGQVSAEDWASLERSLDRVASENVCHVECEDRDGEVLQ